MCSRKIQKEVTFDGDIIIIIESLEQFKDSDMESNIRFWLPKTFPNRIRFIVTADQKSDSYTYLKDIGCDILSVQADKSVYTNIVKNLRLRKSFCSPEHHEKCFNYIENKFNDGIITNALYIKTFCSSFVPYENNVISRDELKVDEIDQVYENFDLLVFDNLKTTEALMEYILEFYEDRLMPKEKFMKLCNILNLTFKGLSEQEMHRIVNFGKNEWQKMVAVFKSFFFYYQGFWKVSNELFRKAVHNRYHKNCEEQVNECHYEIAQTLESSPNCVRKQEEITSHLFRAKRFYELKQVLSNIETFLLLFNPSTKYDLCRYWQILEENQMDPVNEYNKGLESFEMHFNPKAEELFTIILQICRY